jgi:lipocalin
MNKLIAGVTISLVTLFALYQYGFFNSWMPKPVDRVDLQRYLGSWYEISSIP